MGKRNVFGWFLFISTTLFILVFYFLINLHLLQLCLDAQILHGFFLWNYHPTLLWAMIADVADFSEWKNNRRATAIIFSQL